MQHIKLAAVLRHCFVLSKQCIHNVKQLVNFHIQTVTL